MKLKYELPDVSLVASMDSVYVSVKPNGGVRKVYISNDGKEYVRWGNTWRKIGCVKRYNRRGQRVVILEQESEYARLASDLSGEVSRAEDSKFSPFESRCIGNIDKADEEDDGSLVSLAAYQKALDELPKFDCIEYRDLGGFIDRNGRYVPVAMRVHWFSSGDKSLDEAQKFADDLSMAIEAARSFRFNGLCIESYVYH